MMDSDSSLSRINLARRAQIEDGFVDEEQEDTNVCTEEQLNSVPEKYLSGDISRPLLFRDVNGNEYKYALRPLMYSVVFILIVEALERLCYYGISFTQTLFLTGSYNIDWNAGMSTVSAATYVQSSVAITYTMPFLGAVLADSFLGNYWTILLFSFVFYLPGLVILALCAYPHLLGETFPTGWLTASILVLWPIGAGAIKACVNILGAQQYHPVLQKSLIEKYYVHFYMSINIGACIGGLVIPLVANIDLFTAYMIPVGCFAFAMLLYLSGTPRYVRQAPEGANNWIAIQALASSVARCPPSLDATKDTNGGKYPYLIVGSLKQLAYIVPVTFLILPFSMAYGQMVSIFVSQGSVMEPVGLIDSGWMQNFDAFSVILCGLATTSFVYPWMEKKGYTMSLANKFALGSFLGCVAVGWAVGIDYMIHAEGENGNWPSVMWQAPAFFFVGAGEIFAFSTAYEAAYLIAPKNLKTLSSALNVFLIGALPSFLTTALVNGCSGMFPVAVDTKGLTPAQALAISRANYLNSTVYNYFWILLGIGILGFLINLLPATNRFIEFCLAKGNEASLACVAEAEAARRASKTASLQAPSQPQTVQSS